MLHWKIIAAGSPSLPYAKQGLDEYVGRLKHYAKVDFAWLPAKKGREPEFEDYRKQAAEGVVIVLDERGETWTTEAFSAKARGWEMSAPKRINLLIGPSAGHAPETRAAADHVLALSPMTMQHELALLVLLEQMYRVHTMLRGEPYHRV